MGTPERIFEMMKYLCRVRHATMPQLAEKFGVSVRAIKRDVDELGYLIPLEIKTGRYDGGVYVMDGYRWDRAYMSAEDIDLLIQIKNIGKDKGRLVLEGDDLMRLERIISSYSAMSGIIQTGVVILLGRLIGGIEICRFSLGDSGGMLCVGIAAGAVIRKYLPRKSVSEQSMQLLRNLGLVLLFVGNGIPAGMQLGGVEFRLLLYGIMMSLIAIAVGAVLCRLAFRGSAAAVVAGGMTSTPAIAALMQKQKDVPLSRYSFAYVGALITIIVLMRTVPVAG